MQEMTLPANVLDQIVCVCCDISIWTGQKKLTPEDLDLSPEQIPPEGLAALGHKRICDPKAIADFKRIKHQAFTLLSNNGVRFLTGYAIPLEKLEEIQGKLAELEDEFYKVRNQFLSNYEETIEAWIEAHPSWSHQIRRAVEPVERVAAALSWRSSCFKVVHPGVTDKGLEDEANSLGRQLLREIAQEAKHIYTDSFHQKASVTRKALRPLRRIYDKLMSLSFLEPRVQPYLKLMDTVLRDMKNITPIEGANLNELKGMVLTLTKPERVLTCGDPGWTPEKPESLPEQPGLEPDEQGEATPAATSVQDIDAPDNDDGNLPDDKDMGREIPDFSQPPAWFY